ncbi:hypothetical protein IST455A_00125 [Burkholderia multivorans]|uniref:hypothetical protein n=1 Tax=Burkholderia multivorans TaxID=87883 RepID=UPI001983F21B|nr:hypothetical protein [Burkholderia multivorans]CAB5278956.1 hypothetical protein IST419_00347 [Burkholderia multivorans]CAB5285066.1 hypothetical protein IST455A_00125 [Burkholderia multivorans]CAB5287370.1 hypothetical protein IST455B_00125 [Burkholderia multivorans]CAB5288231.1 hypothetical protein IST453_00348 [Burkholderia multivorans]CAB5288265.1 hypothetical protein IST424_00397 [Burkholderia multivorans]
MSARRWAFVLAVGATTTALCLSVLAGWQRGGTLPERLIWIAIGMVLVTSAQTIAHPSESDLLYPFAEVQRTDTLKLKLV